MLESTSRGGSAWSGGVCLVGGVCGVSASGRGLPGLGEGGVVCLLLWGVLLPGWGGVSACSGGVVCLLPGGSAWSGGGGWCVCSWGGSAWSGGVVCLLRGRYPSMHWGRHPPPDQADIKNLKLDLLFRKDPKLNLILIAAPSPPCGQNSWHTLVKILPWPNFVAAGN